jgi:hypothetical protein
VAVPDWFNSMFGEVVGEVNCRVDEPCPPPFPPSPLLLLDDPEPEQPDPIQHKKTHTKSGTTRLLVTTQIPSGDYAPDSPETWAP